MSNKYILRDAGKEYPTPSDEMGREKEKFYPSVEFDIKQLPQIGTWGIGNDYFLIVKVTEVSHSIHQDDNHSEETARFEIKQVGAFDPADEKFGAIVKEKLRIK